MPWVLFILMTSMMQLAASMTTTTKIPMFALVRPKAATVSSEGESQTATAAADPSLGHIKIKNCASRIDLPQIFGNNIYALVRPKVKPPTPEERAALAYQEEALQRIVRCRLKNSLCFRIDPPRPRIEFGKFSWTAQRFEPLRAGISQLSCRMPERVSEADVHGFWYGTLNANGTDTEVQMSVSNYFLSESAQALSGLPTVSWRDVMSVPVGSIAGLFKLLQQQQQKSPDPLDPMYPLNPLFPYSPLNPFFTADRDSDLSPFNEESPFYPSNPSSPFSVLNPGNPFNVFSPVLRLPPSDPMSPFNPASPYHPLNPLSPYNADNPLSPLSPESLLPMPAPSSPFSPLNDGFLMNPLNPYFPGNALARLAILDEADADSPLNPRSPFYPLTALNPQRPLDGLPLDSPLNPLNLAVHPFNLINGEEIPRSLTETAPLLVSGSVLSAGDALGMPSSLQSAGDVRGLQSAGDVLGLQSANMQSADMLSKAGYYASASLPATQPRGFVRTVGKWFYRTRPVTPTIAAVNPCDPRSPYFAGHEYSPFHPLHPSNPYSLLNPLNGLPANDPRSPYNPASAVFAGNPESPYHPQHPMNPFNPDSFLWTCQQTGSLHPRNPRSPFHPLNPRSPFSPLNPASPYNLQHPLLNTLDPAHALNPALRTSPFHASNPASPFHPDNFNALNPAYPLNPLHSHFTDLTSTNDPAVALGWNRGVKEDWSLVADGQRGRGRDDSQDTDQLVPYRQPEPLVRCGPAPPAPPPPTPPYYPGYFQWDPSWPAPKYIKTSPVPVNDPIDPDNWLRIWNKLWLMKCRREAALVMPPQPFGPEFAVLDLPKL